MGGTFVLSTDSDIYIIDFEDLVLDVNYSSQMRWFLHRQSVMTKNLI